MFSQTFKKTFKCLAVWRQTFKKTFKCLAKRLKVFVKVWGVGGGPACSRPQESAEGKARGGAGAQPPRNRTPPFLLGEAGEGAPPHSTTKLLKVFLNIWLNI